MQFFNIQKLFIVILLPALPIMLCGGCRHRTAGQKSGAEEPAIPGSEDPLQVVGEIGWAKTGETLFRLGGGGLSRPVEIPVWIDLALEDYEYEDKCTMHNEFVYFKLPDGLIYIGQYNSWCGRDDACRILDPKTRKFSKPSGGCIPPDGVHMRIEPLKHLGKEPVGGPVWLAVVSDSEGVARVDYITYSPDKGVDSRLEIDLHHDGHVEAWVAAHGLQLTSNFDLLGKHDALFVADPKGSVPRRYRWTHEEGLTSIL